MNIGNSFVAVLLTFPLYLGVIHAATPYAGQEHREIKSLSAQEIDDYLSGRGMGFAKAAELNRYPGPLHVLELAESLKLTPDQRARTEKIYENMRSKAMALGRLLVDEEHRLDRLFATSTISPDTLQTSLDRIGQLQSQIRQTHLKAHLAQIEILTSAQVAEYQTLRGYSGGAMDHSHHTR